MQLIRFIRREYWLPTLLILALLIGQAACELALPAYSSALVDVGVQQSGIESEAAQQLRGGTYEAIRLLLPKEDLPLLEASYAQQGDAYTLTPAAAGQRSQLQQALRLPMAILGFAQQKGGPQAVEQMAGAIKLGVLDVQQMRTQAMDMLSKQGGAQDTLLRQAALQFVKAEYQAQGRDMGRIQRAYLWRRGALMVGLTLLMGLFTAAAGLVSSRLAAKIALRLRADVFARVLSFSGTEMDHFTTASLITRTSNDVQQVQQTLGMMLRIVLYAPILGIGGIIRVNRTNTGIGWIVAVAVGALMVLVAVTAALAIPKFKALQKLNDRLNLVGRELLSGLNVIRAFNRERFEQAHFDGPNTDLAAAYRYIGRVFSSMMPMLFLVMNIITLMIVWFGAKGIDLGRLQVGGLMAFITYTMQVVMAFMLIAMLAVMMPRGNVAAQRIAQVLDTRPAIADPEHPAALPTARGLVRFENVSFAYHGSQEEALRGVSFEAHPGQTTALIGGTGSGKSTVLNLIPRFYEATGGRITIDGVDIKSLPLQQLRGMIGLSPQKTVLFKGTIASNIKFARPDMAQEEMASAAQAAQAQEFISQKDEGYESAVAQGGSNVSGGQKQRLSIARAIAPKPQIILFDDSFSALDFKTERTLRTALRQALRAATVIVVTQRVATVMQADHIVVLEDGAVAGQGTHAQLLEDCAAYRAIAESQLSQQELANMQAAKDGGRA